MITMKELKTAWIDLVRLTGKELTELSDSMEAQREYKAKIEAKRGIQALLEINEGI